MPQLQSGVGVTVTIIVKRRANQTWLVDPTLMACFTSYKQKSVPLSHMKCHMPLALGSVHTGTHLVSKVHTLADLLQWGCLRSPLSIGGTVLPRLRLSFMESQPLATGHTVSFKHTTLSVPISKWAVSSFIYWYSLYTQFVTVRHIDRVTALHCLLKVRWLGTGKMSYIFVLLSVKEIDFCMTYEVGCWAATLCQLMVLLGGELMDWW